MTRGGVNDMGGLRVEHCGGCDGRDTLDTPPLARSGDAPGGKPGSAVSCHHEHMVDNSPESLKRLLGDLDDPEHMERASDFDLGATEKRFADMVVRLERDFGTTCRIDAGVVVQDASYYGQVVVPAEATNSGADLSFESATSAPRLSWGLRRPGRTSTRKWMRCSMALTEIGSSGRSSTAATRSCPRPCYGNGTTAGASGCTGRHGPVGSPDSSTIYDAIRRHHGEAQNTKSVSRTPISLSAPDRYFGERVGQRGR